MEVGLKGINIGVYKVLNLLKEVWFFLLENKRKVVHSKGIIPLKLNKWYISVKIYKPSWYIHTWKSNNYPFYITLEYLKVEEYGIQLIGWKDYSNFNVV